MSALLTLLILCVLMGASSFLVGLTPLYFNLSQANIRMISALGTGILVGTSLIVIIPEGAEAMYSVSGDDSSEESGRRSIGLALITGFMLMYMIDKAPAVLAKTTRGRLPMGIDMSSLRFTSLSPSGPNVPGSSAAEDSGTSTSIGLIIHAIADGVALGASVATGSSALEMIIFVAIMVHKAPASFGLTTVLLRSGFANFRVKRDLGIFAAAAPVGAVISYAIIALLGSSDSASIQWWTGILLVFSGGTFLYVAMHAMQDLAAHDAEGSQSPSGSTDVSDFALSAVGMLIPLVTLLVPDI